LTAFALSGRFACRGGLADLELLIGQTQHLTRLGHDGQAVVLQKAAGVSLANGPRALEGGVAGKVQLGGVVHDQNQRVPAHELAREVPVGLLQGGQSRFLPVAQAVEATQGVPIKDLRERLFGALSNVSGASDQAPRAPDVAQGNLTELLLGPCPRFSEEVKDHDTSP
jgi:hypothetical protein